MRCDSPLELRLMEMTVGPPDPENQRKISFRELATQPAPQPSQEDPDCLQTLCSWCNTFQTEKGWLPVDQAAPLLGLLSQRIRPITHGICPLCLEAFETGVFDHLHTF